MRKKTENKEIPTTKAYDKQKHMKETLEGFMIGNCGICPRCGIMMEYEPLLRKCKCPECHYTEGQEAEEEQSVTRLMDRRDKR